jgi:hypothetical protein
MPGSDDIVAILILLWRCPMPVPRLRAFWTAVRLLLRAGKRGSGPSGSSPLFLFALTKTFGFFLLFFKLLDFMINYFHHIFFNAWRIQIVFFFTWRRQYFS